MQRTRNLVMVLCTLLAFPWSTAVSDGFKEHQGRDRRVELDTSVNSDLRLALVIGNGSYESSPLKNPSNDAEDMARTLRTLGFEVVLGTNWTRREMEDAIYTFGDRLKRGGVGLFYFSGHGMQVRGRNYLIPVGCRVESERDIEFEAVDVGRVLGKMEEAGNRFNIVILDACRNNPFSRSFRSATEGLAQMDAPVGTYIAYATAPGSVAADGEGRNGTYTEALLEAVARPGLKVEDVFKRVRARVASKTDGRQVPWDSSSLIGDFYFVGSGESSPRSEPPAPDPVAKFKGGWVEDLGNGLRLELTYIPAGRFQMGMSTGRADEKPVHWVTITTPFLIGTYEVTQEQWKAVMGTNPSRFKGNDAKPVEHVNWDDAQEFLRRVSEKSGHRYRLPTEAEWEYACRAGTTSDYPGQFEAMVWHFWNAGGSSHPVGTKLPNAWGLYDMNGNVWEWCSDWYDKDYYSKSPETDPAGPESGKKRVLRGGSWDTIGHRCRSGSRAADDPDMRNVSLGMRVAMEVPR